MNKQGVIDSDVVLPPGQEIDFLSGKPLGEPKPLDANAERERKLKEARERMEHNDNSQTRSDVQRLEGGIASEYPIAARMPNVGGAGLMEIAGYGGLDRNVRQETISVTITEVENGFIVRCNSGFYNGQAEMVATSFGAALSRARGWYKRTHPKPETEEE